MQIELTVNGEPMSAEAEPRTLLVHFLRDTLALTGTHWGCDTSNCGACCVLLDGEPVKSCTVLAAMAEGHEVTTIEGLERDGVLDPVQQGFMETHGLQCGFCTPADDSLHAGKRYRVTATTSRVVLRRPFCGGGGRRCVLGGGTVVGSTPRHAAHSPSRLEDERSGRRQFLGNLDARSVACRRTVVEVSAACAGRKTRNLALAGRRALARGVRCNSMTPRKHISGTRPAGYEPGDSQMVRIPYGATPEDHADVRRKLAEARRDLWRGRLALQVRPHLPAHADASRLNTARAPACDPTQFSRPAVQARCNLLQGVQALRPTCVQIFGRSRLGSLRVDRLGAKNVMV